MATALGALRDEGVHTGRQRRLSPGAALDLRGDQDALVVQPSHMRCRVAEGDGDQGRAGGNGDVYVRPFPGPGGKWRVSTEGGLYPQWSTTGHELLFATVAAKIMVAPYAVVGDSFRTDQPQIWSPNRIRPPSATNSAYDLHPDGKRLVTAAATDAGASQDKVVFVFNFADYLRKIAPGTK